jgi:hypothetical protein
MSRGPTVRRLVGGCLVDPLRDSSHRKRQGAENDRHRQGQLAQFQHRVVPAQERGRGHPQCRGVGRLSRKAKSAKDPVVQKEMDVELAKLLKVDAVDWRKHIVLGVIGQGFDSLKYDGKVLTATYIPFKEPLTRLIPPTPKVLVLIERFEGEVKFVPKK